MLTPNLEAILLDLRPAAERLAAQRRRRRRASRGAAAGLAASGVLASAAVGAVAILGGPAPSHVKRDLRGVDEGMPADLRLNPDVEHARSVAAAGGATVYFARLADGGYCAELVTGGRGRGAVCSTAAATDRTAISVTIPYTDPVTDASPVTVSGHVSVAAARTVELVYPDGASDTAAISRDRFYVAEVPAAHLRAVHRHGLLLVARGADGEALAQAVVPFDAITPPSPEDAPKDPIEVETVTDHGDMTRLLRIRGALHARRAVRLELRYPDGTRVRVPLDGRRFDLALPPARRGSLARAAAELTAYAADGRKVASRPVAAVSYWRAREIR
jgi:hypothetical protein